MNIEQNNYNLEDIDRKRLMFFLGECWHEPAEENSLSRGRGKYTVCKSCKNFYHTKEWRPRTFTTSNDMMLLQHNLTEDGKWDRFFKFAKTHKDASGETTTALLMNPLSFCWLVSAFLKREEVMAGGSG